MKVFLCNLLISLSIAFSNIAYSEPVNFKNVESQFLTEKNLKLEEDFVTQHEDITLQVGTLKFPAKFLYKNEAAPNQGYLIKFNDFMRIESFVDNLNKGCDILYDELIKECKRDLDRCQKDCDDRVKILIAEKDDLKLKLEIQTKKTEEEIVKKYIWTSVGVVVGAGLGILIYEIAK